MRRLNYIYSVPYYRTKVEKEGSLLVILFRHCSIVCVQIARLEIVSVLFTGSQNLIAFEQKLHLNCTYAWSITYCYGHGLFMGREDDLKMGCVPVVIVNGPYMHTGGGCCWL